MKKMITPLLVLFSLILINCKNKDTATAIAQNNDFLINLDGIDSVKIGMSQADLEKLLNKKIPLTNPWDTISGSWQDSAKIKYKNIELELDFTRTSITEDSFYMRITTIRTSSPLCKTRSGIGIGSDKLEIIAAYDGYHVDATPVFITEGDKIQPSKTMSTITVKELEEGDAIVFHLLNNKVVSFEIYPIYDDEE